MEVHESFKNFTVENPEVKDLLNSGPVFYHAKEQGPDSGDKQLNGGISVKTKNMPSIETQKRMHAFFMKTSAPRIYKKMMEEKEEQMETNNVKEVDIYDK